MPQRVKLRLFPLEIGREMEMDANADGLNDSELLPEGDRQTETPSPA
ncbi:MAG: hypothetical protein GY768_06520 [Planctomycetaceae bacterium]|nr:hypothetical protein [Planctomycetaceae bacterium]